MWTANGSILFLLCLILANQQTLPRPNYDESTWVLFVVAGAVYFAVSFFDKPKVP